MREGLAQVGNSLYGLVLRVYLRKARKQDYEDSWGHSRMLEKPPRQACQRSPVASVLSAGTIFKDRLDLKADHFLVDLRSKCH